MLRPNRLTTLPNKLPNPLTIHPSPHHSNTNLSPNLNLNHQSTISPNHKPNHQLMDHPSRTTTHPRNRRTTHPRYNTMHPRNPRMRLQRSNLHMKRPRSPLMHPKSQLILHPRNPPTTDPHLHPSPNQCKNKSTKPMHLPMYQHLNTYINHQSSSTKVLHHPYMSMRSLQVVTAQ